MTFLTRGRCDRFSNISANHEFSAGCYIVTVSNLGLLFSFTFQSIRCIHNRRNEHVILWP